MKTLLSSPRIAWPSLLVTAAALTGWIGGLALGASGALAWPWAVLLCWASAYAAFTPLHDASHRVVTRARWGNELAGRLAGLPLWAPLPAFRYLHLEHHKHTNEGAADPDGWSGGPWRWTLPLRWLTQDLHYYAVYLRAKRARGEQLEVVATLGAQVAAAIALAALGYGRELVLFGLLPSRLAMGTLAFAFDWLPHRPHTITAKEDRMRATLAIEGRLWCWLTFGQSLHLVHHLYPGVPFYRYAAVWHAKVKAMRDAHFARGANAAELDDPMAAPFSAGRAAGA
jgi:beta-carotene hydroxylase